MRWWCRSRDPFKYRDGGGGVVAAPAMPPDAAPMAAPVPPPAAAPNRRAGSRTDKATNRSLVEVVGVCTRG